MERPPVCRAVPVALASNKVWQVFTSALVAWDFRFVETCKGVLLLGKDVFFSFLVG